MSVSIPLDVRPGPAFMRPSLSGNTTREGAGSSQARVAERI